ncbi:hypothetical protein GMDG_06055 [Pseudogymnoascus destructans 20631-21]|uniref:acetyl-CoA C-acyltransferase n=2 Tax=Pseudogymnoascus destructans TaxID=655981 RepID=L8FQW5_PSED2|nr:hypothetical protein GMDG_06055 [Pseudogymnoascus destructans 20631-21]
MSTLTRRGLKNILAKNADDIVILSSLRTSITRSNRGAFKDAYPEELLSAVLRATLAANPNLDPALINDVARHSSQRTRRHQSRPHGHERLWSGMTGVAIGGGMESMTRNYGSRAIPEDLWPQLRETDQKDAKDCIMPMGLTSENVAERYGVSRADQDALAVESHRRAVAAQEAGKFDGQIVPTITVTKDGGIRANASLEGMAKLKPAFTTDGTFTAGNSSQISDGAAATLMMRRSTATALGLSGSIIGKWAGSSIVGCKPDEMGIGPAIAIPKLLAQTGLNTDDVGLWEINEAFASQAIHCVRELGLEKKYEEGKVNPNGGAIALGHPLGATGARMVADLLPEMQRQGLQTGVVSMCIGTGMGMAGLFVRE